MSPRYCSWCLQPTSPFQVSSGLTNYYRCSNLNCGKRICKCLACSNYARWDIVELPQADGTFKKQKIHHWYCGEHRHDVPCFDTLTASLDEPSDYLRVYEKRKRNMAKNTKVGLFAIGGAGLFIPFAPALAGAIGGIVGVKGFGLSGAAATAKGMAFFGGGSLAAGGFGIAGGKAVLTAAGTLASSAASAYIGNAIFGDIRDFSISRVRSGKTPAIVTINGFLSQQSETIQDWRRGVDKYYADHAWYHVNWEAKRLTDLGTKVLQLGGSGALYYVLREVAKKASKQAAKKLAAPFAVGDVIALGTNPWHIALIKADQTGILLADILGRCKNKSFILMGNSLGARVVCRTLQTLSMTQYSNVEDVHLLGGAVDNDPNIWSQCISAIKGRLSNYYSDNDDVLKYLYTAGTFFASYPVGRHPILGIDNVTNIDVTKHVAGHMEYKRASSSFIQKP